MNGDARFLRTEPVPDEARADGECDFPQGWWRSATGYVCCDDSSDEHRIAPGGVVYFTGKSGEVYCERHAPKAR